MPSRRPVSVCESPILGCHSNKTFAPSNSQRVSVLGVEASAAPDGFAQHSAALVIIARALARQAAGECVAQVNLEALHARQIAASDHAE